LKGSNLGSGDSKTFEKLAENGKYYDYNVVFLSGVELGYGNRDFNSNYTIRVPFLKISEIIL
jgi:hypothetical protein